MAGFLYYIPKLKASPLEKILNKAGLGHLIEIIGGGVESAGPDLKGGFIFCLNCVEKEPMIGYYPKTQKWEFHNKNKFAIGYEIANPPLPEDMQREQVLPGHDIKLNDGNEWHIPCARKFESGMVLPRTFYLDVAGELKEETMPKFIEFSKMAEDIYNDFCLSHGLDKDLKYKITESKRKFEIAYQALNINYFLWKFELSVLRLINSQVADEINKAIIDIPLLEIALKEMAEQKKKEILQIQDGQNLEDMKEAN